MTISDQVANGIRRLPAIAAIRRRQPAAVEAGARFVVQLRVDGDGLVHVSASGPGGNATGETPRPSVEIPAASTVANGREGWGAVIRAGNSLYATAFPPAVARLLAESRERTGDVPMPIVLDLDDDLAALPWELLQDPESERFLALSERTPLSRLAATVPAAAVATAPETGNLRVGVFATSVDEDLINLVPRIGEDRRVDVHIAGNDDADRPHVVQLAGDWNPDRDVALPEGAHLVILDHDGLPPATPAGAPAAILIPPAMDDAARGTFLGRLYEQLAAGRPLDAAVAAARRAVADAHSVVGLVWAGPVLIATRPSAPLVIPAREAGGAFGAAVKGRPGGWLRETLSGAAFYAIFFVLGLALFRFGLSSSAELKPDILSPDSLYASFKGAIIELSTYQEHMLLIAAAALLGLTAGVGYLWLRNRVIDPEEQLGVAARLVGPLSSLRIVSFLAIATLTVAGAYAYQQYLWNVLLPIPADAAGFAITREAAAASFKDEFADTLYGQGGAAEIVVRELPVTFDATDTDKARELGRRIGAKAVIIYREDERPDGGTQYVSYVVFTDSSFNVAVSGRPDELAASTADALQSGATEAARQTTVEIKEGVEIPALRTDSLTEMVNAAAGIVAWDDNRARDAITLLEQARPRDPTAPSTGIVNFYLAQAYWLDDQGEPSKTALEQAITFYEGRRQAGETLGAQDLYLLASSYYTRGRAAYAFDSDYAGTVIWLDKAIAIRDEVLARTEGLQRPAAAHETYARVFADLAGAYRYLGNDEGRAEAERRAYEELDILTTLTAPDDADALVRQGVARFFLGDCSGAVRDYTRALTLNPRDFVAANNLGAAYLQLDRDDLAKQWYEQALFLHPNDSVALSQLGNLAMLKAISSGDYVEPAYLVEAEEYFRRLIDLDPTYLWPHQELADSATLRAQYAQLDSTAMMTGDLATLAKSEVLWRTDAARRQEALDAWALVIDESRIIAAELTPDDPSAIVALATAYASRQGVVYRPLFEDYPPGAPRDPDDPVLRATGEQILADAAEIRGWTARVLAADSAASPLDRMLAWGALLDALDREWGWHALYSPVRDQAKQDALLAEFRQSAVDAVAFVEATTIATADDASAAAKIYFSAYSAMFYGGDAEAGAPYLTKSIELNSQQFATRVDQIVHTTTVCREGQEYEAGAEAFGQDDLAGARSHMEAALQLTPEHLPSLEGLSLIQFHQGDVPGAIATITKATEVAPERGQVWAALGLYQVAAGDRAAAQIYLNRGFELTATMPPQERMATFRNLINELRDLVERQPEQAGNAGPAVSVIARFLEMMPTGDPAAYARTFQYPELYANLGALALEADDAAAAETLLRRSLALDPHRPYTWGNLVVAVAAQSRDAGVEIEAAIGETRDALWNQYGDPAEAITALDEMEAAVAADARRHPERAAALQPFLDAIEAERTRLAAVGAG